MILYLQSGGHLELPHTSLTPPQAEAFKHILTTYLTHLQLAQTYLNLLATQEQPQSQASYTRDLDVQYLGYKRYRKTSFFVRLREAWCVLLGRPNMAFCTREDGTYTSSVKNAIRATFNASDIRYLAHDAFNTRTATDYIIPVIPFIPPHVVDVTNDVKAILKPFMLEA